jgi:hypothetical protein
VTDRCQPEERRSVKQSIQMVLMSFLLNAIRFIKDQ